MPSNTETLKLKAKDDTRRAFNSVKKNVSSLDRLASKARGGIAGIAGGVAIAGLANLAKKSLDAADSVEKLSRRTGGSAKFLSEMRFALSQNDASLSDFGNSLRKINKSAQDAADGLSTPTRAFQKLGIDVDAFNQLNTDQKFIQLSEAISKVEDPAVRTQTAMDIMGRAGERLIPTMIDGAAGIAAYREEAEAMGLSLSTSQVQGAAAANDAIDRLTSSIGGSITQAILPYTDSIVSAADFTREYLPRAIEFLIDVFRGLKVVFNSIVLSIQAGIAKLLDTASDIPIIGDDIKEIADSFKQAAIETSSSIDETVSNMGKWKESTDSLKGSNVEAANQIKSQLNPAIRESEGVIIGASSAAERAAEASNKLKEQKRAEAQALKDANQAMREAEAEARRYATSTGQDLIRTQEELNRILDEADLFTENYAQALREAEAVITSRGLVRGTEEFTEALEDLGFQVEEVESKTKDSTNSIEGLWSDALGGVDRLIDGFFQNSSSGFDNFFDDILGSLGNFLRSFISKWVQSGINSLVDNIFGGGSSSGASGGGIGGIIGSLFGGSGGGGGGGIVSSISSSLGSGFGGISSVLGSLGTNIGGALSSIGGGIGTAVSSIGATLGTIGSSIGGAISAAAGGIGSALTGVATALGPVGIAAVAIGGLVALFSGGARSFDQIVAEDYLPNLLGQNVSNEAVGADGATGFDGGNTAIFGANFGVTGTGITSQLLNSGENGTTGFFNGAQQNLEEFAEVLRANNIEAEIAQGTLRALSRDGSQTTDDFIRLWQEYANGLTEAVAHSEVFKTATENNLIQPSNLFFENFALGFGQSAFEARDSLLKIDEHFDRLVADGKSNTDALTRAFSEFYGISEQEANEFFNSAGISIEQMADQFVNASGESLQALLDFNADGETVFDNIAANAEASAAAAAGAFSNQLTGTLSNINLGQFNIPSASFSVTASGVTNSQTIPNLGNFNAGGSFTVPDTGRGGGDQPFIIGLARNERVTVEPVANRGQQSRSSEVAELQGMVNDLVGQVSNLVGELSRRNNRANAFQS